MGAELQIAGQLETPARPWGGGLSRSQDGSGTACQAEQGRSWVSVLNAEASRGPSCSRMGGERSVNSATAAVHLEAGSLSGSTMAAVGWAL